MQIFMRCFIPYWKTRCIYWKALMTVFCVLNNKKNANNTTKICKDKHKVLSTVNQITEELWILCDVVITQWQCSLIKRCIFLVKLLINNMIFFCLMNVFLQHETQWIIPTCSQVVYFICFHIFHCSRVLNRIFFSLENVTNAFIPAKVKSIRQ